MNDTTGILTGTFYLKSGNIVSEEILDELVRLRTIRCNTQGFIKDYKKQGFPEVIEFGNLILYMEDLTAAQIDLSYNGEE